jgi:hypothetical protein
MKEHLQKRIEMDKKDLERALGYEIPKSLEEWERHSADPMSRVVSESRQYPVLQIRVTIIRVALRIMQNFKVPTEIAYRLARAVRPDGPIAFRLEDYSAILEEKWGPTSSFSDDEFNRELNKRARRVSLPEGGFHSQEDRDQYYDAIKLLRAGVWALEGCDVPPPMVRKFMAKFIWNNKWTTLPPVGIAAYEIEDYDARFLSRRERTRKE